MSPINLSLGSKIEKPKIPDLEKSPIPESSREQSETIKETTETTSPEKKSISSTKATDLSFGSDSKIGADWQAERVHQIDEILAANLGDIFLSLSPDKQQEFKQVGENTVKEINTLLDKTKVNLGKIVSLIKKWLSIIPSINRFFLEQEAKIKADQIIKLKKY